MICLDLYTIRTPEKRITCYVRASSIYAMTGPFESNGIMIRWLYLTEIDYPMELLDTMDNYDKVVKVLEGK